MHVLVAGGAGFVGTPLCRELVARGHEVTATSRSRRAEALPEAVDHVTFDVTDDDAAGLVSGHDVVVNLIALPSHRETPQAHDAVSRRGTERLVAASEDADVDRFVLLSALGAGQGVDTAFFRAKDRAEGFVRDADLAAVVVRPSVVFGEGSGIERFLHGITPPLVVPLPGAGCSLQPIWVEDLAPMLAAAVEAEEHAGRTYELGGPEQLTLAALVRLLRDDPVILPIPDPLARACFTVAGQLPFVPVGPDQYRHLRLDNTVAENDVRAFGVEPNELTTVAGYLAGPRASTTGEQRGRAA